MAVQCAFFYDIIIILLGPHLYFKKLDDARVKNGQVTPKVEKGSGPQECGDPVLRLYVSAVIMGPVVEQKMAGG